MRYNIIGDIHASRAWRDLIVDDALNIIVGDYFDPYDARATFDDCMSNFNDIITYARTNASSCVVLLGNHDLQYIIDETYSRKMIRHAREIRRALRDAFDVLRIAYACDASTLVTHAGVSAVWYANAIVRANNSSFTSICELKRDETIIESIARRVDTTMYEPHNCDDNIRDIYEQTRRNMIRSYRTSTLWRRNSSTYSYIDDDNIEHTLTNDAREIAKNINDAFVANINDVDALRRLFSFEMNASRYDYDGSSMTQSCVWIRPHVLFASNLIPDKHQIVGHTHMTSFVERDAHIETKSNITFVDVLRVTKQSYTFEL